MVEKGELPKEKTVSKYVINMEIFIIHLPEQELGLRSEIGHIELKAMRSLFMGWRD